MTPQNEEVIKDWLTIPCTTCDGTRMVPAVNYMTDREIPGQSMHCPVCGGRGWTINPQAIEMLAQAYFESMGKRSLDNVEQYPEGHRQSVRDQWDWDQASEAVRSWFYLDAEAGLIVLVETAGDNQGDTE